MLAVTASASPRRVYPLLGPASRAEPRDNRHDSAVRPPLYVAAIPAGHS
jgi:hypothetical protein